MTVSSAYVTGSPHRAPPNSCYHKPWQTSYISNSAHGSLAAHVLGDHWIDNDWHLTEGGEAWGNDHGAPLRLFFARGDRMEHRHAAWVFAQKRTVNGRIFHIRTLHEALTDNHAHGIKTEIEIKDIRPYATPDILNARFAEMARTAEAVYGPDWRHHVVVKVLTNLGGGERYALKICRFASAHRIPTMLLARGKARLNHYYGVDYVTWVRGSLVIKR